MNSHQAEQPKASVNGFRRRVEKEGGLRLDNKIQAAKSNQSRSSNTASGGKDGTHDSPFRDRLLYLTVCLIGQQVEVQLKDGSIYTGTFHTTNIEKDFAIVLKMARLTKDVSSRSQNVEFVSNAPIETFLIAGNDVVQVTAKGVLVIADGKSNEIQHEKHQELMIDSSISQSHPVEIGRELKPWVPDDDDPHCPELENIFDAPWNRSWDQFETNEMLFGVKSTFNEELYTTKLERGPQMRELEREAARIAREIGGEETQDLHLAEERGVHLHGSCDIDEETRFSSVYRGRGVDDSGYEEADDTLLDSRNTETFGDASTSSTGKSADWAHTKSNDGFQASVASSSDELRQSLQSLDYYQSTSNDNAKHLESELQSKSPSTLESKLRIEENMPVEHGGNDNVKEGVEEPPLLAEDSQLQKHEDSHLSSNGEKDGSDQGEVLPKVTAPMSSSEASSRSCEKTSSTIEFLVNAASDRIAVNLQSVRSCGGSGSSTASISDSVAAAPAASGPGLSRTSSVGSWSSEKSTLNPYAKEFKLNPNAKSFTPSQSHLRPPSLIPDGSFYYPATTSTVPHVGGMHMGIGVGPSFPGHQPVIFNPQVAPMQPPQGYFHPGGPQYGQQMLLGHPRPVVYMPNYQPEMQFRGRDY